MIDSLTFYIYNTTETPPFKWMAEGATKTALAIGSKWQEQAFGTGDHKPWLVPGQAQTTTRLGRARQI